MKKVKPVSAGQGMVKLGFYAKGTLIKHRLVLTQRLPAATFQTADYFLSSFYGSKRQLGVAQSVHVCIFKSFKVCRGVNFSPV